ncbi:MAG TPA: menaquinol-cytochrome c reductase cytochrome b subunit, partial [Acidimicrobiales bacterium]|nr:menaquinol-cytochrome c reductase cytochrome b subunit [Acidimicrobiales bacterium]
DKVHTWPHLLIGEFIACLACSAFLLIFSAVVNAPFLAGANFNFTPNPSKAPWYFLGLQELLTMFHPMVAGVTIPGIGIFGLMLAPYIDKNPSQKPEDRKFAIALFTAFFMFWAVLVIIGTLFRGPGFNFTFPWRDGVFFDL